MTTVVLPAYTPSGPVPSYSKKPSTDESTIQHTPRTHERPSGTFVKASGGDTVLLAEQDPAAEVPCYGRQGLVTGFVSVADRDLVSEVVLKVKGKMEYMISEGGSLSHKLIDSTCSLWSSHSPSPSTSTCPGAIPFSFPLPSKFQDENLVAHPLPPSYEVPFSEMPGMFLRTTYWLTITVTRTRSKSRKLQFLTKTNTITIPFDYSPRSRPWRSMQPSFELLNDVKTMPEEFRQVSWEVQPRPKATARPLELHLFLPTVEIFGLDDVVPFHVQLGGPVDELRHFLPPPPGTTRPDQEQKKQRLTVSLVRQVVIEVHGRKAARTVFIASASLHTHPPSFSSSNESLPTLDLSGTLKPRRSVAPTGTFDVGCVRVQDFIVIELWPADTELMRKYTTMRFSHPVKFVTDSYVEGSSAGGIGREAA
uniref:Arrestin-like N-terminal domain-containing protein n=1 Tax=Mycena chlorophos TaxID=658473 RepID=A0ABQ0LL21_MYCCL|nr:predicted protein [Mycena chlorophos]